MPYRDAGLTRRHHLYPRSGQQTCDKMGKLLALELNNFKVYSIDSMLAADS